MREMVELRNCQRIVEISQKNEMGREKKVAGQTKLSRSH